MCRGLDQGLMGWCYVCGWLALLLTKAADVETNPGKTKSHKRVWICDICY